MVLTVREKEEDPECMIESAIKPEDRMFVTEGYANERPLRKEGEAENVDQTLRYQRLSNHPAQCLFVLQHLLFLAQLHIPPTRLRLHRLWLIRAIHPSHSLVNCGSVSGVVGVRM